MKTFNAISTLYRLSSLTKALSLASVDPPLQGERI